MKKNRQRTVRVLTLGMAISCYIMVSIAYSSSANFIEQEAEEISQIEISHQPPATPAKSQQQGEDTVDQTALVDYDALTMINRGDGITRLVGEVSFHHNGAIIQCDSAFLYPDDRMEFFANVIIEKDSALVYGDRVNYDQITSKADVYAPIVKMRRGDATMYSYNLQFDTKTSIGVFHGGGVLTQRGNEMEARRGSFDANASYVKFFDDVEMKNADYDIATDSLGFSINDERLDFIAHTNIWSRDGNYLEANSGCYYSTTKSYLFTSDAYVMTSDNEIWADTMRYYTDTKQAYMFSNVQILDTANMVVAFSDWAFYDDSVERAVLSELPSVRSWKESGDTSYMRADTILMLTFMPGNSKEELGEEEFVASDATTSVENTSKPTELDTMSMQSVMTSDSIVSNILSSPLLQDSSKLVAASRDVELQDTMLQDTILTVDTTLTESLHKEIMLDKARESDSTMFAYAEEVLDSVAVDSVVVEEVIIDTLLAVDTLLSDSLHTEIMRDVAISGDSTIFADSTILEEIAQEVTQEVVQDTIPTEPPIERVIKAYNNVKAWSVEYQMKCDSVVAFSVDSTTQLFGLPVIWYYNNQMAADQMNAYTKNEMLDWAEMVGNPVLSQQVIPGDTMLYNQAIGSLLEIYFTDNEIDYSYLSGNVQNIYYMKEGAREITAMVAIDCADLTMFFANREPYKMLWGGSGSGPIYPMNQIPFDQERFLTGFTWQDDIRPKSPLDICTRRERVSVRAQRKKLRRPVFPKSIAMEYKKQRFLKDGEWRDRTELPTVTPEYFTQRNRDLLF